MTILAHGWADQVAAFRPYPVKLHLVKSFTCERCDRPATRKRTFCRRVRAADAHQSTLALLDLEAAAWAPTMHRWCELRGPRP